MTIEEIADLVMELTTLRFFPSEPAARLAITRMIGEMAHDDDQIRWFIRRMTSGIYAEWPGLPEMRACFCNRHKPKDGINAYSTVYPEGFPPDPTAPPRPEMITGRDQKRLEAGEPMTADAELSARVQQAAEKRSMPAAIVLTDRFARMLREIETPPHLRQGPERPINLDFKPITREDVERAHEEYLRQRDQQEGV